MQGNAYRLYNAVTQWNDHQASTRRTKDKATGERKSLAECRMQRILSTDGLRADALNLLTEGLDTGGESFRKALQLQREEREATLRRKMAIGAGSIRTAADDLMDSLDLSGAGAVQS